MGDYVNSTQTRFDQSKISCGVLEAHHLPKQSPGQTAFGIATALYHKANPRPAAFVIFSDVVSGKGEGRSRGEALADELSRLGVGQVWRSLREVNPKTGNVIQLFVLTPHHDQFRKWYQDELANRITAES